jgi:hypothetical protein
VVRADQQGRRIHAQGTPKRAAAVGLSVLAVPAVANGRMLGDLYRSGDGGGGRDGRSLQVVG